MKYFVILLILIGLIIPQAFGVSEEIIHGRSSFELLPSEIIPDKPILFEIRFMYYDQPYSIESLLPIIEINPSSARPNVHIDVESINVYPGQIFRIPVTMTADSEIEHEKFFLSLSFMGNNSKTGVIYKSGWTDFAIIDIVKQKSTTTQLCCGEPYNISKNKSESNLESPLKQFKSGIAPNNIVCKDKFQLALNGNGHPICIKDTSVEKLSLRNYISDLIIIGIPHALPVINNAEIESMVELFQNRYHTSQITYVGSKIVLNATNVWGETISLVMQPLDDGIDATLTCNHNDWRKQEIITEDVLAHLQNKNCFSPALEETMHKNNAEPGPDYDSNKYDTVFDEGSPIQSKKTGETVLDADNCKRYAYWLTKYQKEKIDLYEDYPRYPPWGNEIFPLVNYCVDVGDLAKSVIDGDVLWRFQLNEN